MTVESETVARSPGARVEMDWVVPALQQAMPYIRVSGADLTEFEQRARSSPHVERLGSLEGVNNRGLYRAEWTDDVESPVTGIVGVDASVLGAGGTDVWTLCLRFDDYDLAGFHSYCRSRGIAVDVVRAYSPEETGKPEQTSSSPTTTGTLRAAVEGGYFEVPRRTSTKARAGDPDTAPQSVTGHVRSATDTLLERRVAERLVAEQQAGA